LVLSSEIESFVADVQDRVALIIKQDFPVPPNDGHVDLTIRSDDLQPVLLFLPNCYGELCLMVGIVGKEAEWVTWTAEKVSSRPEKCTCKSGTHPFIVCAVIAARGGRLRTKTGGMVACSPAVLNKSGSLGTRSALHTLATSCALTSWPME
jgi:hypothetical protein